MSFLPTQPNQPTLREEGAILPPGTPVPGRGRTRVGSLSPVLAECRRQLIILAWLLLFSIFSYHLVSHYVVTAVVVQGRSMLPTLQDGDHYILNRLSYHYRDPQRLELVVIRDRGENDYAVKRLVGMPGETVQIKDGAVYLNGERLKEGYLRPGTKTDCLFSREMLVVLGEDQYFVLGDNRGVSEDSRMYGAIQRSQIIGLLAR